MALQKQKKETLNEDDCGRKQGLRGCALPVQPVHDLLPILETTLYASILINLKRALK